MPSPHKFPSPVGGVGFPSDFAPSIIFAVLYGLLSPLFVYRIWNRKSRNVLLVGSLTFGIERIVIFAFRAVQSHDASSRGYESRGLIAYMQCTLGVGFIAISQDLVVLLRIALVNSTQPSKHACDEPQQLVSGSPTGKALTFEVSDGDVSDEDQPRRRFWFRRMTDFLYVGFLGAMVTGIIGNSDYERGLDNEREARIVMSLRYASTIIAVFFSILVALVALWAHKYVPHFKKNALSLTLFICGLFCISSIYRLCVMYNTTDSLTSTAPGSQNALSEKAAFYIIHILPEWIAVLLFLSFNVRDVFGTGMFARDKWRDESPKEREAREIEEFQQAQRKTEEKIGIQDEDFGMFSRAKSWCNWRCKN